MQNTRVWYENRTPMQPPPQATSCWQRSALQSCWSRMRSGATRLCALCVPCGRAWLSRLAHCSTPRCLNSLYLPLVFSWITSEEVFIRQRFLDGNKSPLFPSCCTGQTAHNIWHLLLGLHVESILQIFLQIRQAVRGSRGMAFLCTINVFEIHHLLL